MSFQTHCDRYLQNINQTRSNPDATPELSLHPHLQTFLEDVAAEHFERSDITFTLEPKNIDQIGRPDIIAKDGLLPIGYIEAERYGTDLDRLTGHAREQNERFKENLDNFILANFVDFELWIDGQRNTTARILENTSDLEILLERFLSATPVQIETPIALARYLARRTRELQTQIATTLTDENSNTYGMFTAFKETLLPTLTRDDFADMYAQTLTYGLFAARCTLPNATNFSRHTAASVLPRSNPFLRQLFFQVASPNLEENVTYILDDITTLLRNVSTEMLRTSFAPRNHLEDPVIHFYETFLKEYNPRLRFDRGVFYTPPQVISYIVRSVDSLLKTELNRPDGLADDDTLILDPATGTGGFLLSVLEHIREFVTANYGTGDWNQHINDQLVKRIFGFELLVAPYTIAHLKLSLFLQAQGWHADERLRIYLTNTLEQPAEVVESIPFAAFISDEANAALSVKRDEPILAIIGNPPYPENSANPSRVGGKLTFIGELIEDYKQVDGEPLGETNVKALQADYVKFTRWAQWRIDKNGEGVIGYIVNNSFLDGRNFRGMRQSLLTSFNTIYLLNLHGSNRKQEAVPAAQRNENVFDISQGVCIMLCVKEHDNPTPATVYYTDMWGSREEKYHILSENDVQSTEWCELQPESLHHLFVPHPIDYSAEYEVGWEISDILQKNSAGIVTSRDKLTIHRTTEEVRETVTDFVSLTVDEAREKYNLGKDSRDWKVHFAQDDLRRHPNIDKHICSILYRPLDTRFTYYTGKSKGFHTYPAPTISPHLLAKDNVALCVHKGIRSPKWQHVLVTNRISEKSVISNRSEPTAHVFPLYLYPDTEGLIVSTERSLNFKPDFLTALSESLGLPQTAPLKLPNGIAPEEILGYIYAVLYSPTYRDRYYEFLKYDFPRIPLPQDIDHFRKLAALGQSLISWHLLKDVQIPRRHRFEGKGDGVVSKVRYEDGNVWINATEYFTDVPVAVWKYEIGAYQVCEKWLKDRKEKRLSHAEVRQYRGILVAVAETLRVMGEIDEVLW